TLPHERLRLVACHRREVVDVHLAEAAEAHRPVALHALPRLGARARHLDHVQADLPTHARLPGPLSFDDSTLGSVSRIRDPVERAGETFDAPPTLAPRPRARSRSERP